MTARSIKVDAEVALLEDLPSHGLVQGQVGRVTAETEAGIFQVEFVQADGTSCTTGTLRAEQLLSLVRHRLTPGASFADDPSPDFVLSPEAYARVLELIDNPPPPSEKLIRVLRGDR